MERQKKVLDASVIVKWFLNENKTEEALRLKEQHLQNKIIIIVPELVFLEVLNTLRFKEKNREKLVETIKSLFDIQFLIIRLDDSILEKSLQISLEYNLSLYDSLYASISQIHGCPLITEDVKLKKFPSALAL